jgi:hypothetical protein
MSLDGRWFMGVLGCDLAADPIERQTLIAHTRNNAKKALSCERPALIVVAVEPDHEDEAKDRIAAALNGPSKPAEVGTP